MEKPEFTPYLDDNKVLRLPYNPKYSLRLMEFLTYRGMIKMSVHPQLDYLEIRFERAAMQGNFYEKIIPFLQVQQEYETA